MKKLKNRQHVFNKVLEQNSFSKFSQQLVNVLEIRKITAVVLPSVSVEDIQKVDVRLPIANLIIDLESDLIFSFSKTIYQKGLQLLANDLNGMGKVSDQIHFLRTQQQYLRIKSDLYNKLNPLRFINNSTFYTLYNGKTTITSSFRLDFKSENWSKLSDDIQMRYFLLDELLNIVSFQLSEIELLLYTKVNFKWLGKKSYSEICEVAMIMANMQQLRVPKGETNELFIAKFLQLFGYSDKKYDHTKHMILKRKSPSKMLHELSETLSQMQREYLPPSAK